MKNNRNIILKIDTSNNKEIQVGLDIDGQMFFHKSPVDRKTQAVLPLTEKLLIENKLTLKDITEINVNAGPGSFTGLRVGVSVANALGFLLEIPINGKKVGELVEPVYS